MKRTFAMVILVAAAASTASASNVPSLVNYQGLVTRADGTAVDPGTYAMQFRLWSKSSAHEPGEQLIWARQYDVSVVEGQFNVVLGDTSGQNISGETPAVNDVAYAFAQPERYLELTVVAKDGVALNPPWTITPRQRILSVPYAINGVPAGVVEAFAGPIDKIPPGWLLCDGSPLKSTDYPILYALISEAWGNGTTFADGTPESDPQTDFNLPDLRGRFLRGDDGATALDPGPRRPSLDGGSADGVGSIEDDTTRIPRAGFSVGVDGNHHHALNCNDNGSGCMNGGARGGCGVYTSGYSWGRNYANNGPEGWVPIDEAGSHSHSMSGGDSETLPINACVGYIIKY